MRAFAANDANAAFLDVQAAAGTPLADAIEAEGGAKPLFRACDLLDIQALRVTLNEIHATLGPASVLVNNAANDQRQDFSTVTPDAFDWSMSVNLKHVYFASQAVVPQMHAPGGESIINMRLVAWMVGGPDMQAYSAAKAAIVGFTNSLARDVGKWRIRVNAIAPGVVITPRQRDLWFQDETKIEAGLSRQSIPDVIDPADIEACSSHSMMPSASPSNAFSSTAVCSDAMTGDTE